MVKTGLGQDSHVLRDGTGKPLVLGGVVIEAPYELEGNSDADVIVHALINAISGITAKPILGAVADEMCALGVTDSSKYLKVALKDLQMMGYKIGHVSISVEAKIPKILPIQIQIRSAVAKFVGVSLADVGLTATTGEGLTSFGQGKGIACTCIVTAHPNETPG